MAALKELYDAALANQVSKSPRRFRVTTEDGATHEGVPTVGSGSDPNRGGAFVMHLADGKKVRLTFDQVARVDELT